ncbi:unnamed protein product [Clavelina lepadiformis]|uniref:Uncharacterized protein n=1 Tax=Clavelina lepadiformis TaxID=159417 RepID=A0ABP0EWX9_CLALP
MGCIQIAYVFYPEHGLYVAHLNTLLQKYYRAKVMGNLLISGRLVSLFTKCLQGQCWLTKCQSGTFWLTDRDVKTNP